MDLKKSRKNENSRLIVDLIMMGLLLINLSIIIFDWFFLSEAVRGFLKEQVYPFYEFYNENIHENFVTIDLFFVVIFLTELLIRWAIAIKRNTYHRWFFYPFVHWYDTLGCIPIASFRFLRILRVISIAYRLQRLAIVDLTQTYPYKVTSKYYNIIMEEISDRVVINILNGVQGQVKKGNPVAGQIVDQVIAPKKELLIEWLANRIRKASAQTYYLYQDDVRQYLSQLISESIEKNTEIKMINQVPVFGNIIISTLEKTISDVTYHTLDGALKDISAEKNHHVIHGMTKHIFESLSSDDDDHDLTVTARQALLDSLELIKQHIKVKQWKFQDVESKEAVLKAELERLAEEGEDKPKL